MKQRVQRQELVEQLLDMLKAQASLPDPGGLWPPAALAPEGFEALREAVQAYQSRYNLALHQFWRNAGVAEGSPIPTDAFKDQVVCSFAAQERVATFRSSGSTSTERGAHHFKDLRLMNAALPLSFGAYMLPKGQKMRFIVLGPSATEAPESSLYHMFAALAERYGTSESGHFLSQGELNIKALSRALQAAVAAAEPVFLLGASFSYVHLLDSSIPKLSLPPGSRALETGGFKGKSREVSRAELHRALVQRLGLQPQLIAAEYGMSELSSQLYEPSIRWAELGHTNRTGRRLYLAPPWMRVEILDPIDLSPRNHGEFGSVALFDLLNLDSASWLLTGDIGRLVPGEPKACPGYIAGLPAGVMGLELQGRAPGAPAKGCSLQLDQILG